MDKKKKDPAFVLDADKFDEFVRDGKHGAKRAMERFDAHQPKPGVRTPFKGSQRRGN